MFFLDTNVLLYLFSGDTKKADLVEELLSTGAIINVQVLNEFTSVALRKLGMTVAEVRDALEPVTLIGITPRTTPVLRENSKQAQVLAMLRRPEGATLAQICAATEWQQHTVRGTFAGAFKKKLGLTIESTKEAGGERVYRIAG